MRLLIDTHLLVWASQARSRVPAVAADLMGDPSNQLWFSVVSIWEVAIKHGLGRFDFAVDPRQLRIGLQYGGYRELAVAGDHVVGADTLPSIHRDPFDRLLIMQASVEDMTLLTADRTVARYPGPIRLV